MKKEESLKKNTELEELKEEFSNRSEAIRKEFSKAFNWYKEKGAYDSTKETYLPTWYEIFTKIGKLLERQNKFIHYENIQDALQRITYLEEKIKENNENNPKRQ